MSVNKSSALISVFLLYVVIIKVMHQRFANIQDTHSSIDRFVEDQLRSLHVNRDEIFYLIWSNV